MFDLISHKPTHNPANLSFLSKTSLTISSPSTPTLQDEEVKCLTHDQLLTSSSSAPRFPPFRHPGAGSPNGVMGSPNGVIGSLSAHAISAHAAHAHVHNPYNRKFHVDDPYATMRSSNTTGESHDIYSFKLIFDHARITKFTSINAVNDSFIRMFIMF